MGLLRKLSRAGPEGSSTGGAITTCISTGAADGMMQAPTATQNTSFITGV